MAERRSLAPVRGALVSNRQIGPHPAKIKSDISLSQKGSRSLLLSFRIGGRPVSPVGSGNRKASPHLRAAMSLSLLAGAALAPRSVMNPDRRRAAKSKRINNPPGLFRPVIIHRSVVPKAAGSPGSTGDDVDVVCYDTTLRDGSQQVSQTAPPRRDTSIAARSPENPLHRNELQKTNPFAQPHPV